jgi:hypothetical protein
MERIGDQLRGEHIIDRDGLSVEHRRGVGAGAGPLIDRDLRGGHWVVAEFSGVSVGDQRVSGVLAEVTVGNLELRLRRAPRCAGSAKFGPAALSPRSG